MSHRLQCLGVFHLGSKRHAHRRSQTAAATAPVVPPCGHEGGRAEGGAAQQHKTGMPCGTARRPTPTGNSWSHQSHGKGAAVAGSPDGAAAGPMYCTAARGPPRRRGMGKCNRHACSRPPNAEAAAGVLAPVAPRNGRGLLRVGRGTPTAASTRRILTTHAYAHTPRAEPTRRGTSFDVPQHANHRPEPRCQQGRVPCPHTPREANGQGPTWVLLAGHPPPPTKYTGCTPPAVPAPRDALAHTTHQGFERACGAARSSTLARTDLPTTGSLCHPTPAPAAITPSRSQLAAAAAGTRRAAAPRPAARHCKAAPSP